MVPPPNQPRDEPLGLPLEAVGGPPMQAKKPISVTAWVPFSGWVLKRV